MNKVICPVCESYKTEPLVQRAQVPIHQNLLFESADKAKSTGRGTLDIRICHQCGFSFNAAFDLSLLAYGDDYENAQEHSPAFQEHLDLRIQTLVQKKHCRNKRIVEVGCGQGQTLKALIENAAWDNIGYGFDPSYHGPIELYDGRLKFFKSYYNETCAHIPADIILCRHVIEHVPDPVTLLRIIRQALIENPSARLFFETPDLEWILRNQVFWDFFYEHCSYFTSNSLRTCFELAGFEVISVDKVFGEQYLWLEAVMKDSPSQTPYDTNELLQLASDYTDVETELLKYWQEKITSASKTRQVALWGAGAKGATFANLIDPEYEKIACVIDINPKKQGFFIAGTSHPIISPQQAQEYGINMAMLMNTNYLEENRLLMATLHPDFQWLVPEPMFPR